jgi:hypothetical protein
MKPVTELRDRKGRHIYACSKDFSEALINVVINWNELGEYVTSSRAV